MEKLFEQLIKDAKAKKSKRGLILLKNGATHLQNYELAAALRDLEKKLYPITKEQKDAKEIGKQLNLVFRMVDLNISDDVCWKIYETMKMFNKMKGKFSIKEASQIIYKTNDIFEIE